MIEADDMPPKHPLPDAERKIIRDWIARRAPSPVSIMPTGLDKQLTRQQLADLIVFLKNAK